MNDMMIFSNPEFGNVRTVTIDGNPWFVGIDVAKALGYVKERNAIASHVDKEDALKCSLPSNSGVQETIVINESGLFSLILSSKLESANFNCFPRKCKERRIVTFFATNRGYV